MRLRQFVFVAEDLKAAVVDIGATLGLPVCFNDPNVGRFGLQNALLPIGGDGGYMIILQCDAFSPRRCARRHSVHRRHGPRWRLSGKMSRWK
jgi:hypothetical protein